MIYVIIFFAYIYSSFRTIANETISWHNWIDFFFLVWRSKFHNKFNTHIHKIITFVFNAKLRFTQTDFHLRSIHFFTLTQKKKCNAAIWGEMLCFSSKLFVHEHCFVNVIENDIFLWLINNQNAWFRFLLCVCSFVSEAETMYVYIWIFFLNWFLTIYFIACNAHARACILFFRTVSV